MRQSRSEIRRLDQLVSVPHHKAGSSFASVRSMVDVDHRLRIMVEPQQGATYEQLLGMARVAERAGFDGFFRSDHLLTIGPGPKRDATEAWTTLAALARETSRLRLGTLVSPMTFRHPAVLARTVTTVDQLSGGRVELGLGAGWFDEEHLSLGIPLPPMAERMARFEDGADAIVALLGGGPVDHAGPHFRLDNAISLPRPAQQKLPIIIGGHGGARSVRVAARLADEYNTTEPSLEAMRHVFDAVRLACEARGRDPATMQTSWMGPCVVARDEATLRGRCRAFADLVDGDVTDLGAIADALRGRGIVGTYAEAAERMRERADAGCQRFYLQLLDLEDHEMVEEIARDVAAAC
jgi:F420-dependent oxidoreductase-like protein